MSLAALLYPSPTPQGWTEWTHANYQHHLAIEKALLQVKNIQATPFHIWPVQANQFDDWLGQHQEAHTLFCQALGIQGVDLSGLDLSDKSKKDEWMYLHFTQHQAAAQLMKLSIL